MQSALQGTYQCVLWGGKSKLGVTEPPLANKGQERATVHFAKLPTDAPAQGVPGRSTP
jgi:hypothetical protein